MQGDVINIGLMGCGTVAGYGHLPAICATDGLSLRALFDPDQKQVNAAGEKFGVLANRCFTSLREFISCDLHAVTVTSPAPFHAENVLAAAERGLHVLCEKPLADSDAAAQRMIDAMREAQRELVVGYIYRFNSMAVKVREIIRAGAIGDLRLIRLSYIWDCHGKYVRQTNAGLSIGSSTPDAQGRFLNLRRDRFMREGGPMVDCGVHEIDLAAFWAGAPISRFDSHGARIDDAYPIPDHLFIHATHANGVKSMMEASFSYSHTAKEPLSHYRFEAIGTGGVVCIDFDQKRFLLANNEGTTQLEFYVGKDFDAMYRQFRKLIASGDRGAFATGEDALIASRIAQQATDQVDAGPISAR